MRFVRTMFLLSVVLGTIGCLSSSRNRPSGGAAARPTGGGAPPSNVKPFWADNNKDNRKDAPPLNVNGSDVRPAGGSATDYNGVLAGTLVDAFNRPVPRAYIQVALADGSSTGRPVEMAVENGYFVIPGLTPNRAYLLTARTADGERRLAGRVQATPPNARLVIKVSEDMYSGTVPPPPVGGDIGVGTSGPRGPREPEKPRSDDGNGWRPDAPPARSAGADPPPPPDAPPSDLDRAPPFNQENIAGGRERDPRRPTTPMINVPGGTSNSPPDPDPPPSASGPHDRPGAFRAPSAAPFCEFVGPNRLKNFALHDVYGQPWEFRQAQGRLILIDFWGTWCRPCVAAIPHIKRLHAEYGPLGLEVVSIACERGSESSRSKRVLDAIEKHQINYRVLLGEEYEECPVQQKFRVQSYPTLVLLDHSGNVLWRGDSNGLNQLENVLKRDLRGVR